MKSLPATALALAALALTLAAAPASAARPVGEALQASPAAPAAEPAPRLISPAVNVFGLQEAFPAHLALLADFKRALADADFEAMEAISSNAVAIFPRDAIWRYNLACARTRQGRVAEGREALLAAAVLGFSDEDGLAADADLALLRRDAEFKRALTIVRSNRTHPESVPGVAAPVAPGATAPVSVTNTVWNMEIGGFSTLFGPRAPSAAAAPARTAIPGQTGAAINAWLAEGTASGNAGDLYDNHDRGHSTLDTAPFSGLIPTTHSPESRAAGTDTGLSFFTFPGRIAIGNSSTANTVGPNWGSCARRLQNEFPHNLLQQYLGNTIYVYPQHHDYLPTIQGDVFPSRTPYLFISPGSSWTDRPILACLATALAAMRPEVKDALAASGRVAPALQYLLRMAQTNVAERADYATAAAHPVVFDGNAVDTLRLATLAHSLTTNALPPLAPLRVLADESASYVPGRDYPDARGERSFDSPFAISRVWRAPPRTRRMIVSVQPADPAATYRWFVGQGDPAKISIRELAPRGRAVEITVEYHKPHFATPFGVTSCRADVICVADDGVNFSAPSFISWYFPPVERRTYDDAGRIVEIDYASCQGDYADPALATHFSFRDVFSYAPDGSRTSQRLEPPETPASR